jgi:trans-aconitate methyltransferase
MSQAEFDRFSASYDEDLAKSLAVTGEARDFYARGRVERTAQCVSRLGLDARRILDYGCGDGTCAPMLAAKLKADRFVGVDVSSASIAKARRSSPADSVSFLTTDEWVPDGSMDLVYSNGVFHHIPPSDRKENLTAIRRALGPEGLFAFWENNPWNPGTRYVMSQCAFDEDAIAISPREAREMLTQAGFSVLRFDFLFYFPRQLRAFRPAERWLRRVPFGGQYQVLCKR